MGLGIASVTAPAAKSNLTTASGPGVYRSRKDGSIAVKGDSGKKMKNRSTVKAATHVQVTSATTGRTFIKDISKLTDQYDFVGRLDQFELVPKAGQNVRRDF